MLKKPVAAAILAALSIGVVANVYADTSPTTSPTTSLNLTTAVNIDAAPQDTTQQSTTTTDQSSTSTTDQKAKKLDTVVVSGSLINNAQIQTATPTYTVTAADIKARGFNSVTEVLQNAVQATGSVQGPQTSGGFTQGAQTVSLYGLPPEFTLTELQRVFEIVRGEAIDRRNFRKWAESLSFIKSTGKMRHGSHRPAALFRKSTKALLPAPSILPETANSASANDRSGTTVAYKKGYEDALAAMHRAVVEAEKSLLRSVTHN